MPRPGADVVIPFGGPGSLEDICARAAELRLGSGDTVTVVDNRPMAPPLTTRFGAVCVLRASERQTPAFARNRGVAAGSADWLVFLDADCRWEPDLLDRYLQQAPAEGVAVLAGAIRDAGSPAGRREPLAVRYARLSEFMSQDATMNRGRWSYAQTANCAVRRVAFETVGGFRADARAGEDADLCLRLVAAGWTLDARPAAAVVHQSRDSMRALLGQCAIHGAGVAWLDARHPGAAPARRWPGLALWSLRRWRTCVVAMVRGDGDAAVTALIDPVTTWAYELGRRRANRRSR